MPHPLIFVHIQKTGGTTLRHVLRREYKSTFGINLALDYDSLSKKIKEEYKKERAIQGHMVFGAHNSLAGNARYVSMVRDPIDRVISDYYYVLRTPTHDFYDPVAKKEYSLSDYVESKITIYTNNLQTRLLSGVGKTVPVGSCSDSMLEQAKQNIREHFAVVGLTDRFNESLVLMQQDLGWSTPKFAVRNKTRGRPDREQIPESTREVIAKHNDLDLRLYDFVSERFEAAITDRDQGRFLRDLRWLRLHNAVYSPSLRVYIKLRKAYNWLTGREKW